MNHVTLTPAYGRDYKSAKAAKADYAAGKDFILNDITSRYDGKPINKQDVKGAGLAVTLRFDSLRKVTGV